ncbi:hypothetical protein L0156_18025 [bacterium]|nr:hypothetical protein [bacterium]
MNLPSVDGSNANRFSDADLFQSAVSVSGSHPFHPVTIFIRVNLFGAGMVVPIPFELV